MKRFLILAALLLVPGLLNAMTAVQTHSNFGKFKTLTIDVTTDAAGGQERIALELPEGIILWYIETDPGSTAPTDDYDLAIYNGMHVDIMGTAANNRDTSTSEATGIYINSQYIYGLPVQGPFELDQSGNSANAGIYRVRIYYTE